MARRASPTDFNISVDGVGNFTFARRRMADEINIQVEYARMIQGVEPTDWLAQVAGAIAELKVLTVRAPEDWDIEELDPLADESYLKLLRVQGALSAKEADFRRKPKASSEGEGTPESGDGGVLVPPTV